MADALFSFTFTPPNVGRGRTAGGQFAPGMNKSTRAIADEVFASIRPRFEALAKEIQEQVAASTYSRLERDGSTGRLRTVTLAAGNRDVTQSRIEVGIPSFLDRSAAKYWRQIEQGTSIHLGRTIVGGFDDGGEWTPPRTGGAGSRFKAGGSSVFARGEWGKGVIRQPIVGKDAYGTTWRSMGVGRRADLIVAEAIQELHRRIR